RKSQAVCSSQSDPTAHRSWTDAQGVGRSARAPIVCSRRADSPQPGPAPKHSVLAHPRDGPPFPRPAWHSLVLGCLRTIGRGTRLLEPSGIIPSGPDQPGGLQPEPGVSQLDVRISHLDPNCPTESGLRPGCGSTVAMLEFVSVRQTTSFRRVAGAG